MKPSLRVALFTDSFDEANGVATFCQQFAAFTLQQNIPFLCVRPGSQRRSICDQSLTTLELKRSPAAFPIDYGFRCDPLLSRYKSWVTDQLRLFGPDLVHITGPGDFGILGFWAAHSLGIPLVASWHTNLHEYAGRRLDRLCSRLPAAWRKRVVRTGESLSLDALMRFYRLPRFVLAPNESMIRNRGYMPLVADLLWRDEYITRKAAGSLPTSHTATDSVPGGTGGRSGGLTWGDRAERGHTFRTPAERGTVRR